MNQDEERHIGVHHGARELENNVLLQSIPGLKDLYTTLDQFRSVAYNYNNPNYLNKEKDVKNGREKFNNNISILANRGMGKSSALLTIIREITNGRLFVKENYSENNIDIINPMIDPEDIQSDILGWVIASLSQRIDEMENMLKKNSELLFSLEQSPNDLLKELKEKKNKLISCYSISGEEYNHVALHRSVNVNDYSRNLKDTLINDYELHPAFEEFIDCLVDTKRQLNRAFSDKPYEVDQEPLIYFFFDDLDMSSKKSIKILTDILSYFYHQNIVIFVSGEYEVFEHSIKTYFLNETKDITLKMENTKKEKEVIFAKNRAEYFLKKVLPPSYRYYIYQMFSDKQKAKMHYNSFGNDLFEKMNIFQLLSYIFCTGFIEKKDNNNCLKTFLLPRIFRGADFDVKIEEDNYTTNEGEESLYLKITGNENVNYLYAYLSVFSVNTRGFMNAYNYLYKEAETIYKSNISDSRNYWTSNKIREFLQILINSKHTYLKYENNIRSFLSIKDDEINTESNRYSKLRIDCEELQVFILELVEKMKRYSTNKNKKSDEYIEELDSEYIKGEIKALIMLPILVNELFYVIHQDLYEQRYKSIQNKLKNILVNTYVNSLNEKIKLLPSNLGMRRTLCIFQQIISRMSVVSLQNINNSSDDFYGNSNNKKYIVQLYLSTIELANAGANMQVGRRNLVLLNKDYYEEYKNSTYTYLKNRISIEKNISLKMNVIYKKLDREWLSNLIIFSAILAPNINSTEYQVHQKFLKLCTNITIKQFDERLDRLYQMICRNDTGYNYYIDDKKKQEVWFQTYYYMVIKRLITINENVTKNTQFTNINIIRNRIITIDKKWSKDNETYSEMSKAILSEITSRIHSANDEYEVMNRNVDLQADASLIVNLLDDLKMEFELVVNKLNNYYEENSNFYNLLENQIAYYYDEYWDLPRNKVDELLSNYSMRILNYGLERNFRRLRMEINNMLLQLENIIIEENDKNSNEKITDDDFDERRIDREYIVDEITTFVRRLVRNQGRRNYLVNEESLELRILDRIFENYLDSYYLYTFIQEACKVSESKDTKFFLTFKKGIENGNYGRR